jgi:DNA-damage-inducible protein D
MDTKLVVFRDKEIRRVLMENEWYFAVVDIVEVLTESDKPRDYWYRLKKRESESSGFQLSTLCRQLKLESTDGKKYFVKMVTRLSCKGGNVRKMN